MWNDVAWLFSSPITYILDSQCFREQPAAAETKLTSNGYTATIILLTVVPVRRSSFFVKRIGNPLHLQFSLIVYIVNRTVFYLVQNPMNSAVLIADCETTKNPHRKAWHSEPFLQECWRFGFHTMGEKCQSCHN